VSDKLYVTMLCLFNEICSLFKKKKKKNWFMDFKIGNQFMVVNEGFFGQQKLFLFDHYFGKRSLSFIKIEKKLLLVSSTHVPPPPPLHCLQRLVAHLK
jgi:hypothetical protein